MPTRAAARHGHRGAWNVLRPCNGVPHQNFGHSSLRECCHVRTGSCGWPPPSSRRHEPCCGYCERSHSGVGKLDQADGRSRLDKGRQGTPAAKPKQSHPQNSRINLHPRSKGRGRPSHDVAQGRLPPQQKHGHKHQQHAHQIVIGPLHSEDHRRTKQHRDHRPTKGTCGNPMSNASSRPRRPPRRPGCPDDQPNRQGLAVRHQARPREGGKDQLRIEVSQGGICIRIPARYPEPRWQIDAAAEIRREGGDTRPPGVSHAKQMPMSKGPHPPAAPDDQQQAADRLH